jgi:hypothetical protein
VYEELWCAALSRTLCRSNFLFNLEVALVVLRNSQMLFVEKHDVNWKRHVKFGPKNTFLCDSVFKDEKDLFHRNLPPVPIALC